MKQESKKANSAHPTRFNSAKEQDTRSTSNSIADLEYYAGLMESIRDAVISTDENFIIKSWNKGAEEIYGWASAEAIGKTFDELLVTDYGTQQVDKLVEDFRLNGYFRSEVVQQTKQGKKINILASSSALYDKAHHLIGAVTVNKDISERKKLDGQLKILNEKLESQVRNKTEELNSIFERITDGFIALDTNWNYIYANKRIGELTQRDPKALIGKNVWEAFPDAVGSATYNIFHQAMAEQKFMVNTDHYEPLGLWQENHVYPSPQGLWVFIKDITEKKKAEEKVARANRLYFFISQVNQMIVRVKDEETLFKEACNIAVDLGKFRMAWIGKVDPVTKKVIPVMHAGEQKDYLKKIRPISVDDVAEGRGPTGTAIREGKYVICNDIENAPEMAPWKEAAMDSGYAASMALPLKKFGKVIGAFSFYATVKDFFDAEEIALLEEATGDVSFALENFEKEALRKKAEAEIARAYHENEITLNRINDSVVSVDNEWRYTFLNDAALATHPAGKEATIGKILWDVHPEMRGTIFWDKYHEAMEKKISIEFENFYEHMGVWFNVMIYPSAEGLTFFYKDITERKTAEQQIRKSEERLRLVMNAALDAIIWIDRKGLITFWNPQAEKIFGWKEDEVIGRLMSDTIVPLSYRSMHENGVKHYLETGEGPALNIILELKAINRAGIEFPIELTVLPIRQEEEVFFCAFIRDISHRKEEEIRIEKATIHAQETERFHIGLELHDNINQVLVGSLLNLGMIRQAPKERIPEFVEMSRTHILNAIDEIRKLSHRLAPASFDDVSLEQAFESLLLSINSTHNFRINISFDEFNKGLISGDIQINLYRILQEQVNNIVKYSNASLIEVAVTIKDNMVRLRIYDNGIGFNAKKIKKGIGLANMKKRAELFSGTFTLNTSDNNGCEIIVSIPLDIKE